MSTRNNEYYILPNNNKNNNGLAVCIFICLTSLTLGTYTCENKFFHLFKCCGNLQEDHNSYFTLSYF
jgi:hypothetical protein